MQHESGRYFFFDNARALLVFLVIFGHLIELVMKSTQIMRTLYLLIYTFHVPAFVFISGFFAKNYARESKQSEILRRFLVPYFFAQILLYLFDRYLLGLPSHSVNLFTPLHALWYLMSLFFWYVMLPYVLRLRFPVLVSIVIALAIGYFEKVGLFLSFSRTFVFLPFFLSGYFLDISHIKRLKRPVYRTISLVYFLSLGVALYVFGRQIDSRWLLGAFSYKALNYNEWYAFAFRMILMALSFTGIMAFLSLLPERKLIFTRTGRYSIYPYVLHVFVVYWFYKIGRYYIEHLGLFMLLIIFVFSMVVYILFSSKLVVRLTRPVIEPKLRFLLK